MNGTPNGTTNTKRPAVSHIDKCIQTVKKFAGFSRVMCIILGVLLMVLIFIASVAICFTGYGILLFPFINALGVILLFLCIYIGNVSEAFIFCFAELVSSVVTIRSTYTSNQLNNIF